MPCVVDPPNAESVILFHVSLHLVVHGDYWLSRCSLPILQAWPLQLSYPRQCSFEISNGVEQWAQVILNNGELGQRLTLFIDYFVWRRGGGGHANIMQFLNKCWGSSQGSLQGSSRGSLLQGSLRCLAHLCPWKYCEGQRLFSASFCCDNMALQLLFSTGAHCTWRWYYPVQLSIHDSNVDVGVRQQGLNWEYWNRCILRILLYYFMYCILLY